MWICCCNEFDYVKERVQVPGVKIFAYNCSGSSLLAVYCWHLVKKINYFQNIDLRQEAVARVLSA